MTDQINDLFAKALGIAEPWFVKGGTSTPASRR